MTPIVIIVVPSSAVLVIGVCYLIGKCIDKKRELDVLKSLKKLSVNHASVTKDQILF